MSALAGAKNNFSTKAFGQGLVFFALVLALLGGWLYTERDNAITILQKKLASKVIEVDWSAISTEADKVVFRSAGSNERTAGKDISIPNINVPAAEPLEPAPLEGLTERTPAGATLPVIRERDGLTPFKAYRRPFNLQATTKPVIALAIMDVGLSDVATESAIRTMPPEVTMIFSPYSEASSFWVDQARGRGHEVWLSLPMESRSYPLEDPGPHTMLIGAPERENLNKLEYLMTRASGYVGFVSSYHPTFMQSATDMRPIIGNIYTRGLGFIDGSMEASLVAQTMALGQKAPFSSIDVWIDRPNSDKEDVNLQLQLLETMARQNGSAAGGFHTMPLSYQQVLEWIEKTRANNEFILAPLSATTGF